MINYVHIRKKYQKYPKTVQKESSKINVGPMEKMAAKIITRSLDQDNSFLIWNNLVHISIA